LNLKKILSILIISAVIVVVLVTIGDLGKLIEETTGNKQVTDLGMVRNCNPSIAVCSYSGKLNGKNIRISMNIDEVIYIDKNFPVNLHISGLSTNQIKAVKISLDLAGVDIQENQQHLQTKSKDITKLTSHWFTKIKIPQQIDDRKDWLAIIRISVNNKIVQLIFQL